MFDNVINMPSGKLLFTFLSFTWKLYALTSKNSFKDF